MNGALLHEVRVIALREEAVGVVSCELRAQRGELPPCPAGAHVDVYLPNSLVRQYSVALSDATSYTIAVKREAASRGGSAYIADSLRVGSALRIGPPRDSFPLVPSGPVVLVAGGIGITALLPMARQLSVEGREWVLHYAVRRPEDAAFAQALRAYGRRVRIHATAVAGRRLDIAGIVREQPAGTHYYCCGPSSMLESFEQATAQIPGDQVHLERFAPAACASGEEFIVRLARSGKVIPVAAETTIVDALLAAGIEAPSSCQQGICGSCEVKVLEGIPDHRDDVLTESEKSGNGVMMICCSRAKSHELVLDL